jgi:hypothetical protein
MAWLHPRLLATRWSSGDRLGTRGLLCYLADMVEIDARGLDAEDRRHHRSKQRGDDQAVKQPAHSDRNQQDGEQECGCNRADLGEGCREAILRRGKQVQRNFPSQRNRKPGQNPGRSGPESSRHFVSEDSSSKDSQRQNFHRALTTNLPKLFDTRGIVSYAGNN